MSLIEICCFAFMLNSVMVCVVNFFSLIGCPYLPEKNENTLVLLVA